MNEGSTGEEILPATDGWIRTPARAIIHVPLGVLTLLLFLLLSAEILLVPSGTVDSWVGWAALLLGVPFGFSVIQIAWDGIRVSDTGVLIRNDFRTHRHTWPIIRSFYVPE